MRTLHISRSTVEQVTSEAPELEPQVADDESDEDLVAAVGHGDEQSLLTLYTRHARPVYALVLRMLHDDEAAEEAVQDAFMRLWRRANDFDPRRSTLRTWLLTIAHHLVVDELRRRRSRPFAFSRPQPPATAASGEPRSGDPLADPVAAAEDDETGAEVRAALAAVPGVQRAAIELAYFGGLSQTEIAAATGVPLGTIKSRIRFGMLALQAELERRGYVSLMRSGGHG
jgi:RNA polymerase sigma-70 factor (ECF subfamily)